MQKDQNWAGRTRLWKKHLRQSAASDSEGEVDFHPTTYYTHNPDAIVRDIPEILEECARRGWLACKFICGRGKHNPDQPEKGVLHHKVREYLESLNAVNKESILIGDRGGSLWCRLASSFVRTVQRREKKASDKRRDEKFQQLRRLRPEQGKFLNVEGVRLTLLSILEDYDIFPRRRDSVALLGIAVRNAQKGIDPPYAAELFEMIARWSYLQLLMPEELEKRKEYAKLFLRFLNDPELPPALVDRIKSERDWCDLLDALDELAKRKRCTWNRF